MDSAQQGIRKVVRATVSQRTLQSLRTRVKAAAGDVEQAASRVSIVPVAPAPVPAINPGPHPIPIPYPVNNPAISLNLVDHYPDVDPKRGRHPDATRNMSRCQTLADIAKACSQARLCLLQPWPL